MANRDVLRSPFENVMNILPQGSDNKPLKQAFYNTAATLFAVLVCVAGLAVYYILEIFLKPLLWAVLCGTFLHPFKHTLTFYVTGWLKSLRKSGTPLVVGAAILPVQILDSAAEVVGSSLIKKWKVLLSLTILFPSVYLFYKFAPLQQVFNVLLAICYLVYDVVGYFSAIWVWSLAIGFTVMVVFFWTPQSSSILRRLSIPVWIAVVLHLVSVTGPFRVPLCIAAIMCMAVGFVSEMSEARKQQDTDGKSRLGGWRRLLFRKRATSRSLSDSGAGSVEPPASPTTESIPEDEMPTDTPEAKRPVNLPFATKETASDENPQGESKPEETDEAFEQEGDRSLSDLCFIGLFWAIVVVQLCRHITWILPLLPLLIICLVLKKLGIFVYSLHTVQEKCNTLYQKMCQDSRVDVLIPKPIRGMGKLLIRGDGKVVAALEGSMDSFMSGLLVLLVLVGTVLMSVFLVIQFHRESMHLVSVTSNILNNSVHPELSHWLPDNVTMSKTIDSMVGNAYLYSREWIADKAKTALGDKNEHLEEQILSIFDQVYEKYVARNTNNSVASKKPPLQRRMTLTEIDVTNVSAMWDMVMMANDFDLDLWAFVQENLGVFKSVLESVWIVLRSNLTLCANILTASLSAIMGGGTAILNFVISMVIFITTLFYLLAASSDTYLPVQWFMRLSPAQGEGGVSKFGQAVEEAIGSVFLASLKMAAFYGLYTWLTHVVFGIHVVYIPAALAAMFAAIPFLGPYWAAFPAIIELWLVNGEGVLAILLLVAHMLPSYIVDTAIYSDIKGGHPFLTGLSIAGGIYWLGLEGAIIGPILLCCLVVAVNVYSTMLTPDTTSVSHRLGMAKRVGISPKRSLSIHQ